VDIDLACADIVIAKMAMMALILDRNGTQIEGIFILIKQKNFFNSQFGLIFFYARFLYGVLFSVSARLMLISSENLFTFNYPI
jgi:hypothetical protein